MGQSLNGSVKIETTRRPDFAPEGAFINDDFNAVVYVVSSYTLVWDIVDGE
ncbi:hypothetical protein SYK_12080 [Pseudodesulfovibrio nedwellii]|uniref:Uncharacterized protein n=1 Tax=Pseudodesulfovibrio nedwellii TaxID=2973072 RepID=A0ABM8AZE7_9BACT|nr:hypothetical protein SYK_12080 [Pseudodesulfovibrio nedwellii]